MNGTLAVAASAEDVVGLAFVHVLSGSLFAALVAVEPLKRRRVADTDRVGRGPLGGNAPSLLGTRLLVLPILLDEVLAFGGGSLGVSAGGDNTGTLAVGGIEDVVIGVLSVAVVGGPIFGLAGDLWGL
jgi:hypothetical protein